MINAVKSELRKLFTVRSTYVLSLVSLLLVAFVDGFIEGYHLNSAGMLNSHHINDVVVSTLASVPLIFGSIIAILLMTHEYRYNTIMYTLAVSNSRSKVLIAKIVAVTVYALPFTLLVTVFAALMAYLGIHLNGGHLVAQSIPYASLLWRSLYYGWTSLIISLALAVIIRSQVGAIVTMFVIPVAELTLTPLLKDKAVYLPFTGASNAILQAPPRGSLSYVHAALVFTAYLVVGWIVAWVLFLKRDAN